MEGIKAGDVVMLKHEIYFTLSNRNLMTVSMVEDKDSVRCRWFLNGEPKWASFDVASLTKVED